MLWQYNLLLQRYSHIVTNAFSFQLFMLLPPIADTMMLFEVQVSLTPIFQSQTESYLNHLKSGEILKETSYWTGIEFQQ
jgi:hypothetical protein